MKPSELISTLPGLIKAGTNVFIWGPPGIGKSDVVRHVAESAGRPLVDVRAVLLDPVDLRGIPHINGDGRAHWAPPGFLPHDPESDAIVFMDELAQAAPLVQSACLQLVLDRRIGEYELPKGCAIVAASNRQEDRAGAHRIISPLLNRFCHVVQEVSNEDWHTWAAVNNIDTKITAFLRFKPALLMAFDPKSADFSFPTPRSWAFASQSIAAVPLDHWFSVVAGCVGKGAAAEFMSFVELYHALPDLNKVLADPETSGIPEEPSVLYALCGALSAKLRDDPKNASLADAYTRYVTRLPPEFAVMAMRDGEHASKSVRLSRTPAGSKWAKDNRDLVLAND